MSGPRAVHAPRIRLVRALALVVLLTAALGATEWALRRAPRPIATRMDVALDFHEALHDPVPDVRAYIPRPGAFRAPFYRINSLGLRGDELPLAKAAGELRIAALGDSVAFGFGVPNEQTFETQLETVLAPYLPEGRRLRVMNAGVGGYNTAQEAAFLSTVVAPFEPDLVVLMVTANDRDSPMRLIRKSDGGYDAVSWKPSLVVVPDGIVGSLLEELGTRSLVMRRLLASVVPRLHSAGWIDRVRTIDPESDFDRAIRDIAHSSRKLHAGVIALLLPRLVQEESELQRAERESMRSAIEKEGMAVLDPRPILSSLPIDMVKVGPGDDIHPNSLGFNLLARFVAHELAVRGLVPTTTPPGPVPTWAEADGRQRIALLCGMALAPPAVLDRIQQQTSAVSPGASAVDLAALPVACDAQYPPPAAAVQPAAAGEIAAPPFTRLVYWLDGRFRSLRLTPRVGAVTADPGDGGAPPTVQFRMLSDLREVGAASIGAGATSAPFTADVSGATTLILETNPSDESAFGWSAAWIDAWLQP